MTDVSGVRPGIQPQPQAQVEGGKGAEGGRGADPEKGIIAKGLGFLSKVWAHLTGKAGAVHDRQMASLRDHVTVKFGQEGLLRLNETLQKKGWAGDSTKVFSGSEIASTLRTVDARVEADKRIQKTANDLQKQPLSEQLKNPTLREASYEFGATKFATGQVEFLDAVNDLEANEGSMMTEAFNARVTSIVSKHIDQRGQTATVGADLTAVDHNINVSSDDTKLACQLLDRFKDLSARGEKGEANKVAEQMFDLLKGKIKEEVNRVWKQDNAVRKGDSGPMANFNRAFTTAATEVLESDPQFHASMRAARAGEFGRV